MGKTSKPIAILCIGCEPLELYSLVDQGHRIDVITETANPCFPLAWEQYDVIIGPKCWRWLPDISGKWINLLLKEARAAQPPRIKKAKVKKGGAITG